MQNRPVKANVKKSTDGQNKVRNIYLKRRLLRKEKREKEKEKRK